MYRIAVEFMQFGFFVSVYGTKWWLNPREAEFNFFFIAGNRWRTFGDLDRYANPLSCAFIVCIS